MEATLLILALTNGLVAGFYYSRMLIWRRRARLAQRRANAVYHRLQAILELQIDRYARSVVRGNVDDPEPGN
jgi:hypothetical protein